MERLALQVERLALQVERQQMERLALRVERVLRVLQVMSLDLPLEVVPEPGC